MVPAPALPGSGRGVPTMVSTASSAAGAGATGAAAAQHMLQAPVHSAALAPAQSGSGIVPTPAPAPYSAPLPPLVQSFMSSAGAHQASPTAMAQGPNPGTPAAPASAFGSAAAGGPMLMPPQQQQQLPKALPTGLGASPNAFGPSAASLSAAGYKPQQPQQQPTLPAASARRPTPATAPASSPAAPQQSNFVLKVLPQSIAVSGQPHPVAVGTVIVYGGVPCLVRGVMLDYNSMLKAVTFTYYLNPLG